MKEYLHSLHRSKTTTLRNAKKGYAFSDNIVAIIVISNRCELRMVGNSFPTIRLRLDRIETLAQSGIAIVTTIKILGGAF